MNSAELQQAAERFSGKSWRITHDRDGAAAVLAHALGVNTSDLFRWHRWDKIPEDAVKGIDLLLTELDESRPAGGYIHHEHHEHPEHPAETPQQAKQQERPMELDSTQKPGPVVFEENAASAHSPSRDQLNNVAIRIWQIDMAKQHITRNAGMLGLGGNATHQSLNEERDVLVGMIRKLGEDLAPK